MFLPREYDWFICSDHSHAFTNRPDDLLSAYNRHPSKFIFGEGESCWHALWLAAHQDVALVVLNNWRRNACSNRLYRATLRELYAVTCTVILLQPPDKHMLALLPNAQIYSVDNPKRLPEAMSALQIERTVNNFAGNG